MRKVPLSYYATIAGSLAIAVGLVVVSYGHIRTFAIEAGAAEWEASVIAVTVDALVVLSIAAIGHARGVGQKPPAMAKVALIVGIVATTGANVHHGLGYGWAGIVVSLWVPVAAELAYQLAMSAVRVGAHGHQEERRLAICGGRTVPVSAVMVRVAAGRAAREEEERRVAAAMAARPVICGAPVSVADLVATAPVAAPDVRPVICGHTVPVAMLAGTLPVVEEEARAVICGAVIDVAALVATLPTVPERPVICQQVTTPEELTAPLSDDRPVICGGHLVSVAEVLAHTPVATPMAARPDTSPATVTDITAPVATVTGDREEVVMEWLTDPATEVTVDTATGADVVALLLAAGHGRVSQRTGRRILATARAAMAEETVTA